MNLDFDQDAYDDHMVYDDYAAARQEGGEDFLTFKDWTTQNLVWAAKFQTNTSSDEECPF
jgi:hypothetical protein